MIVIIMTMIYNNGNHSYIDNNDDDDNDVNQSVCWWEVRQWSQISNGNDINKIIIKSIATTRITVKRIITTNFYKISPYTEIIHCEKVVRSPSQPKPKVHFPLGSKYQL